MEYRRLGRTGLKVSAFSLGSWATFGADPAKGAAGVDVDAAAELMAQAREAGVNFCECVWGRGGDGARCGRRGVSSFPHSQPTHPTHTLPPTQSTTQR